MKSFKLTIITPKGVYLEQEADEIYLNTATGYAAFLPNYHPLITEVKITPMFIKLNTQIEYYAVFGGILNITKDGFILITDSIEKDSEIDIERAKEEYETFLELKKNNSTEYPKEYIERKVQKNYARFKAAEHKVGE